MPVNARPPWPQAWLAWLPRPPSGRHGPLGPAAYWMVRPASEGTEPGTLSRSERQPWTATRQSGFSVAVNPMTTVGSSTGFAGGLAAVVTGSVGVAVTCGDVGGCDCDAVGDGSAAAVLLTPRKAPPIRVNASAKNSGPRDRRIVAPRSSDCIPPRSLWSGDSAKPRVGGQCIH